MTLEAASDITSPNDARTRFLRFADVPPPCPIKPRIGLIAPSANCVVEAELHALAGDLAWVVTSRAVMTLGANWGNDDEAFRAAVKKIHDNYDRALEGFSGQKVDHLIIGDAGFWLPMAGHYKLSERLSALTGTLPTLSAFALLDVLREIGARKVAVITPRQPVSGLVSGGIWEEEGFEVTGSGNLACQSADDIASTAAGRVSELAHELAQDGPDAIIVSGTNIALAPDSRAISDSIGVPLLHINQVLMRAALRTLGLPHAPLWKGDRDVPA